MSKFKPTKCGFIEDSEEEGTFYYLQNDKVKLKLFHVNYWQGIQAEWLIHKVIHCVDSSSKSHVIFEGKIPTNEFWEQLKVNLIF